MIKVVLVDDQALFRAGVRMLLASQPDLDVVGEAGDGREGVALVRATRPDVVPVSYTHLTLPTILLV